MTLALTVAIIVLLASVCAADDLPAPVRERFNCSADGSSWPFLLQLPQDEPEAILLYLHGHYGDEQQGMTTETYGDAFGRLRRECLRRRWAYVTTWYGGNTWMGPLGEAGVADLVLILRGRWPGRPLLICGASMGGTAALIFAMRRPELVDGVVALCPAADIKSYYALASAHHDPVQRNIAAAIRVHYRTDGHDLQMELQGRSVLANAERLTMPVYISHGAEDPLIPVESTRALCTRLQELGRTVKYVETRDGGHDTPLVQVNWSKALDFVAGADLP